VAVVVVRGGAVAVAVAVAATPALPTGGALSAGFSLTT
jgi:hypothetical protein